LKVELLLHPFTNDGKKIIDQKNGELQYFVMAFFLLARGCNNRIAVCFRPIEERLLNA